MAKSAKKKPARSGKTKGAAVSSRKKTAAQHKPSTDTSRAGEKPRQGFMWKLLERKEAERKRREQAGDGHGSHIPTAGGSGLHSREHGFSKFSGPRRRSAS